MLAQSRCDSATSGERRLSLKYPIRTFLGLSPGDYRIDRVYANGKVGLADMKGRMTRIQPAFLIKPGS